MEYVREYLRKYLSADEETRKASKKHWLEVLSAYYADGDLDGFSTKMVAVIALADYMIEQQKETKNG